MTHIVKGPNGQPWSAFFGRLFPVDSPQPKPSPRDFLDAMDFWQMYPQFAASGGETVFRTASINKATVLRLMHGNAEDLLCIAAMQNGLDPVLIRKAGDFCRDMYSRFPELLTDPISSLWWPDLDLLDNPTLSEERKELLRNTNDELTRLKIALKAAERFEAGEKIDNDKKTRATKASKFKAPPCPKCGGTSRVTTTRPKFRRFRCDDCGHDWKKAR